MWAPLIEDEAERRRLSAIIAEVAAALEGLPRNTIGGLTDAAMLRAYLADLVVPDNDDDPLSHAVSLLAEDTGNGALYGGAARVGWTVAHLTEGAFADQACAAIDAALLRSLSSEGSRDYDLVSGLVGFGVYALERGEAGHELARCVLDALERLARPRGDGIAWFTAPELLPAWQRDLTPGGYWNLGLAHGNAGTVALLARYVRNGVAVDRARRLLDGNVGYFLGARQATQDYPGWEADGVESVPSTRVAWCYGDLGISLALLSAAMACEQTAWRDAALALARRQAARPLADSGVIDAGLCHGAAGAMHMFHRLYRATGEGTFLAATRSWLERTLTLRSRDPIAGFPSLAIERDGARTAIADASLLSGACGVALALHALIGEAEPLWDRLLLIDL